MSRLSSLDAALEAQIVALPPETLNQFVGQVVIRTVGSVGIQNLPAVRASIEEATDGGLSNEVAQRLDELVTHLDEVAWEIEEQGNQESYLLAFTHARAANSVLFFVQRNNVDWPLDVCYESYAATGSLEIVTAELAKVF